MEKKKIKIKIRTLDESFKESRKFARDFDKGIIKKQTHTLGFADFKIYKKMLSEKKLDLLKIIKTKKPENIKELATITKRDFKNIYEDVKTLETLGLIELKKNKKGLTPIVLWDEIELEIKIPLTA
tara:strand:+ start:75 stop:452 length:378 start_codon:yes stop_codon:yes gene_type:complete